MHGSICVHSRPFAAASSLARCARLSRGGCRGRRALDGSTPRATVKRTMKIDRIETINLLFEYAEGFTYAGGKCTARVTTLVLVHCDNGQVGVGSAYSHPGM